MIRLAWLTVLAAFAAVSPLPSQEPSYYRGAVINDGFRDMPAILELGVSERTDTSIAGWLRVNPPLAGSGFAYGSPLGADSLEMVSVSATGDTIVWQSATRGQRMGGRYKITGGQSAGQTGTWSLVAAPDPSRASRVALAIAGGLALVAVLFLGARRIAPAWWRRKASAPAVAPEHRAALTGLGGWLAWFLFGHAVLLVVLFVRLSDVGDAEGGVAWLMADVVKGIRPVIAVEETIQVAQLVGVLVGLVLLAMRRAEAPVYWMLLLATLGSYAILDLVAAGELGQQLARLFGEEVQKEYVEGTAAERRQNGRLIAGALVWGLYWHLSKRVRLTFAPRSVAVAVRDGFSTNRELPANAMPDQPPEVESVPPPEVETVPPQSDESRERPSVVAPPAVRRPSRLRRRHVAIGGLAFAAYLLLIVWARQARSSADASRGEAARGGSASTAESPTLTPREIAQRARAATVQIRALDAGGAVASQGTGFFVSRDGLIGTNLHVIRDARELRVQTLSGDVYDPVYFVTADAERDIAILKVRAGDARPLPLAGDAELDVGDPIYVMGNPLGQVGTFSDGLVSARRAVGGVSLLQITAPVSRGSSGGPVVNARGEVVGIATLVLRGGQNLNYAVPVRYIRPLLGTGAAPRPYAASLLPPAVGGLSSIDVRPGGGHAGPAGPSRRGDGANRARRDAVGRQFVSADSAVRAEGGRPSGEINRGSLDSGDSARHTLTLASGGTYVVRGFCDEDCSDLDLKIAAPSGKLLDSDADPDDYPYLRFTVPASGTYRLTVTMVRCSIAPCAYGVRLYRFQTPDL